MSRWMRANCTTQHHPTTADASGVTDEARPLVTSSRRALNPTHAWGPFRCPACRLHNSNWTSLAPTAPVWHRQESLPPVLERDFIAVKPALAAVPLGSRNARQTCAAAIHARVSLPAVAGVVHDGDDLPLDVYFLLREENSRAAWTANKLVLRRR